MLGVVIDEEPWMTPPVPGLLTGEEVIAGASSTVRDFWAWALSNLRANTVRGTLAEYLVACAVGSGGHPRIEWDAYDVLTPGNRRIEVKSGAYLQAWEQPRHSKIIFRGLTGSDVDLTRWLQRWSLLQRRCVRLRRADRDRT